MAKNDIYQLKVTLQYTSPPIWRRLEVPGNTRLDKLHLILQIAMGWWDAHLHQFIVGGNIFYGEPHPDYDMFDMLDESKYRLNQIAQDESFKFIYEYDFGDSWNHILLVEKIFPPEKGVQYPRCIKGKGACPPEDIGGAWGFEEFVKIMSDSNHPEYEDMAEWWGDDTFDPTEFDIEAVNATLQKIK